MKPNPASFEPYVDPNGGEWIRMKTGQFQGTVWRPTDMKTIDEVDGEVSISFECEFLGDPIDDKMFEKTSTAVVHDILKEMMEENTNG